jgi:hypothetical protein
MKKFTDSPPFSIVRVWIALRSVELEGPAKELGIREPGGVGVVMDL